jgi:hypothetical protein
LIVTEGAIEGGPAGSHKIAVGLLWGATPSLGGTKNIYKRTAETLIIELCEKLQPFPLFLVDSFKDCVDLWQIVPFARFALQGSVLRRLTFCVQASHDHHVCDGFPFVPTRRILD